MAGWNPKFEVNLLDVLEQSYDSSKLKDRLREFVGDLDFKRVFGNRVVEEIIIRTREGGVDKNGRSMGSYSKAYKNSLVFDIYKAGQTAVDLTLTGEMLESLNAKLGKYTIAIQLEGEVNRGKAQGHITGKLGKHGRAKPRDFLGLPKGDLSRIFKESMKDYRAGAFVESFVEDLPTREILRDRIRVE